MTEGDEKKYKFSLSLATVLISVLAPLLYSFGYMYTQGYMNEFGLSGEFFSKSFQYHLYIFFFLFTQFVMGIFTFSLKHILWLVGYLLIIPLAGLVLTDKRLKRIAKKITLKTKRKVKKNHLIWVGAASMYSYYIIGKWVLIIITISFTLVIAGFTPFNMGTELAVKQKETFLACDRESEGSTNDCVFIYKGDIEVISGFLIAKSNNQIGIWNGKETLVYPLTNETIVIQKVKKKISSKSSK